MKRLVWLALQFTKFEKIHKNLSSKFTFKMKQHELQNFRPQKFVTIYTVYAQNSLHENAIADIAKFSALNMYLD